MSFGPTEDATTDIQDMCDKIKTDVMADVPPNPLKHYTALLYCSHNAGSYINYLVKIIVKPGTTTSCIHIKFKVPVNTSNPQYNKVQQGHSTTDAIKDF